MKDEFDNDADSGARLDAALRAALRREDAPAGFAQRLEARMAREGNSFRKIKMAGWRLPGYGSELRLAIAAALLLALLVPLGLGIHGRAQAARGEAAKQQVMLALRITGTQLRTIQHHTHTINAGMPEGETQ